MFIDYWFHKSFWANSQNVQLSRSNNYPMTELIIERENKWKGFPYLVFSSFVYILMEVMSQRQLKKTELLICMLYIYTLTTKD